MHAIKIADRSGGAAILLFNKLVISNDPHSALLAARSGRCKPFPSRLLLYEKSVPRYVRRYVSNLVELSRGCEHGGLSDEDFLAINGAFAIKFDAAFAHFDINHSHLCMHEITGAHGGEEA